MRQRFLENKKSAHLKNFFVCKSWPGSPPDDFRQPNFIAELDMGPFVQTQYKTIHNPLKIELVKTMRHDYSNADF